MSTQRTDPPFATVAQVGTLRKEVAELRSQMTELTGGMTAAAREALRRLQEAYAEMTPEERVSLAASEREAREFFGRDSTL